MLMLLFTTFAVPYLLAFGEDIDPSKKLDGFQVRPSPSLSGPCIIPSLSLAR